MSINPAPRSCRIHVPATQRSRQEEPNILPRMYFLFIHPVSGIVVPRPWDRDVATLEPGCHAPEIVLHVSPIRVHDRLITVLPGFPAGQGADRTAALSCWCSTRTRRSPPTGLTRAFPRNAASAAQPPTIPTSTTDLAHHPTTHKPQPLCATTNGQRTSTAMDDRLSYRRDQPVYQGQLPSSAQAEGRALEGRRQPAFRSSPRAVQRALGAGGGVGAAPPLSDPHPGVGAARETSAPRGQKSAGALRRRGGKRPALLPRAMRPSQEVPRRSPCSRATTCPTVNRHYHRCGTRPS
jgi:hypothetical protein